jgi:inner membrane protein
VPSPIAHGIAGVIVGCVVDPPPAHKAKRIAALAAAGMAADLDLLVGAHSGPSHGIGAAVIVGIVSWVVTRPRDAVLACAIALAYASHTLLDWLGSDSSPPIGIMALWPFSHEYFESPWHVFMAISRRYWLPEFWTVNLLALGRELLILVPLAVIVILIRRTRSPNREQRGARSE